MESVKYILGLPEYIEGIGDIFPIRLIDYDAFAACAEPLYISKLHFETTVENFYLLDALVYKLQEQGYIQKLEKLFSLVLKKEVYFVMTEQNRYAFVIDEEHFIGGHNYESLRAIIMKQNILFEPKVYKDPLVQKWANKVLEARAKNNIKMELEDMISTIAAYSGKHYWDLKEYTIYQLKYEFYRIAKLKSYDSNVAFRCVGAEVPLDYFAENIDIFKSPYDDIFVDDGKMNINKVMGNK